MSRIEARGIEKYFDDRPVLRQVSFGVESGTCLALLGANGSGKSTLLRILSGLLRPEAGELLLDGVRITFDAAWRRRIGVLGHEALCYPELTAGENLQLYARLYGVADPLTRTGELLRFVGMERWERGRVATFSRGMLQRIALARALLHKPGILLLDEPFTGLDPAGASFLERTLLDLKASGVLLVLVTHAMEQVPRLADSFAVLRKGRMSGPSPISEWAGVAFSGEIGG